MGDCTATASVVEKEEDLLAAIQEIVKALQLKKNLSGDFKRTLANLGSQLISISRVDESKNDEPEENKGLIDIERQLIENQDKIMYWEKNQSMIWDFGTQEAHDYLKAADQVRKLTEDLENNPSNTDGGRSDSSLLMRAHDLLQTAMSRLEDEFHHLLMHNRQSFEPEHVSFRSSEDENIEACSVISSGDDSVDYGPHRDSTTGRASEEYAIELMHPDVILELRGIANLMFDSSYGRECSQVFVNVQKDALDDCLFMLEVEKLSIEDVLKMEWGPLNSRIRRWVRAVKHFVRVNLAAERLLADQVFAGLGSAGPACFAESSWPAFRCLLDFAEAIAVGPHQPEKLIRILNMHEALAGLGPDVAALFPDGPGPCVRAECADVLGRLSGCARATFLEFETAVGSNVSSGPFPGGGVHHLTKYVMNYIITLKDYDETLDEVLRDPEGPNGESESPMAHHFRALISILERNLDGKSGLYRDESLQHLFLMNNVHYMAEKVKNSELRTILGDDWIRKHNWQFQQHAMNYERATWSSILALLMDEKLQNPSSTSVSRSLLKERLQGFNLSFEEVYKSQTGWSVPDSQLREDLRISASLRVIQAYRIFIGRHMNQISEKHIKYTADDLEGYILDLFEGSQKSLHGHRR